MRLTSAAGMKLDGVAEPRLLSQVALFKGANLVSLAQGQANVVQTVQQAVFAKLTDLERIGGRATGGRDSLLQQVDHQPKAWKSAHVVEQTDMIFVESLGAIEEEAGGLLDELLKGVSA